ncbi:hypothetical protein GW835_02520 [archaeon]|nr:hypothetical protein [archaeon]NCP79419.1 hypothetical protein [archaeon]NCP97362.1 hypothetical protein [archaeon]NCQ07186.1 hypothetical protein [archaeon]NCQ50982.1 hypothetical protein [archaeon]
MGLRSFYFKQEEKYFNFLDRMEKKGINLYKIIDPLEKNGIPTFLVFNIFILLLILFLVYLFVGQTPLTDENYTLTFVNSQDQPISNQAIEILLNNNRKILTTNEFGISEITDVEIKSYDLEISSEKYTLENPLTLDFKENTSHKIFLKSKTSVLSKTIYFKTNNELYNSPLTISNISCSNNSLYTKNNLQTNDGSLTLDDIPTDCGYLEVAIESSTINAVGSLEVSEDSPSGDIDLSFEGVETGSAKIIILDKDLKVPIQNISISILNNQSQIVTSSITNANGIASFEEINVGTYNLLIYDEEERYKPVTENESLELVVYDSVLEEKEVLLEKAFIGKLNYKIIDTQSKEAIENVAVTIYKGNDILKTINSNKEGDVSFGVEENISYKVLFNHPNYIIRTENNQRISESIKQIALTPITNENLRSLVITVVDDFAKPVDFATIRLWDDTEDIILRTITADIYGKAVFTNLDLGKEYRLDATKDQFTSNPTNPFRISEQEITEETIKMSIGEGTFNINLVSEYGEFYQGNVYVYDATNDTLMQDKTTTTNQDGFTIIKIRADKQIYFVIDNLDSKFITPKYSTNANEINTLNFTIPGTVGQTSGIEFLGFYNAEGEKINSVAAGMQVTAKYLLNVTKEYSKAVAHIRTGEVPSPLCSSNTYNVLEDLIFIKDVRYAKSDKIGSLTFTPCNGEGIDFSNKTLRNAKWFNLTLNNPMQGSYLIEADVVVLDTAFANQALNYRAEFYQGSSIIRSPVDSSYSSSTSKQNLYAQAKQVQLFLGTQNQCTSLMCYAFIMTNTQNNLSRNIIDSYKAKLNNDYRLSFSLNVLDGKIAPNSMLVISSGSSVDLDGYSITSGTGSLLVGEDYDGIDLGSLVSNDLITGELAFKVIDDVSDVLDFSIVSNGEVVFSKKIYLEIDPAKEMFVEFVPRKIVPFVSNDLLVVVTDDSNNFISNAIVELSINDRSLTVGSTNQEGLFGHVIPATDLGDVLKIVVKKDDYKTVKTEIVIDDKLITTIPEKIDLTIDSSKSIREVYNFSLYNESYVPLTIVSASAFTDNEFVDLDLGIEENIINGVSQNDISLTATLTDKGINLYNQQTINTEVAIKIKSEEMNKTWVITVPLTVRIVLGNSLDSLECLKVLPLEGTIRAKSQETKTLDFTLENTCTSKNVSVDLGTINAMVDWGNESETGLLSIVVSGKEYILENLTETEILSTLLKKSKTTLQLKFKAHKIVSDVKIPIIYFTSKKGNINGVDEVKTRLPLKTIINDYSECIEIPRETIPALACNWYSGLNNYGNYYGGVNQGGAFNNPYYGGNNFNATYNPNNQFNSRNYYQQGSGYVTQQQGVFNPNYNLVGQTNYTGNQNSVFNPYNFPSSQYQNTFGNYDSYNFTSGYPQGNYGNMGFTNNMNCPTRPFYIKNNCSEAVDIKLDSIYGLTIATDKEFTIEPGDTEEISVLGGESMGTFKIPVNAKASLASNENYSTIGDVLFSLTLPISFMSSNCIQVTPQKLDFSNIIDPNYQLVKVINTCFAQGYRIVEVNYLDLISLDFDGVSFLNVGDMQGRIQPIKVDTLTNTTTNEPMEVWEIALRRNPEIENTKSVKEYMNKYSDYSLAAGVISSFRKILIDVEDAVNLKFSLQVGLQPPTGQASLIYNNIGMELKDNFQWLILDNPDNIGLLKDLFGDEAISDEEISFIDTSVKLTYTLDPNNNAVIINVPEGELAADKFTQIDQDPTSKRCFYGYVKDFPITGIVDTSYIQNSGKYYLNNKYDPLDVSLEFITRNKNIFKLCFERPVESFDNILATNDNYNILDLFKTSKDSLTNQNFEIWRILDTTNKGKYQGSTLIGVKADVSTKEVGSKEEGDSGKTDPSQTTDDSLVCLAPDLSTNLGHTGSNVYSQYGFDKILLDYLPEDITDSSCEDYFCDQEQFYNFLTKKADKLKEVTSNSNYININGIYFEKENNTIKESKVKVDLCANGVCDGFDVSGKETLNDYINQANKVLNAVPADLKKITIIKTKGLTTNGNKIVTIGDYQYTTVDYFLENYDSFENKAIVYANMDVYFGSSPQVFSSNLKKFSGSSEDLNKKILANFNNTLTSNYTIEYAEAVNISKPGTYTTVISLENIDSQNKRKINLTIGSKVSEISEEYSKNILFTYPINPEYTMKEKSDKYNAPFIKNKNYTLIDYPSEIIQDGYIFKFEDMANYDFIDSRPFYFNKPYSFKIIETNENNTELDLIENKASLFLLKDRTNKKISLYSKPQITSQDTKNNTVFLKTTTNNNYMIYNLQMNNVLPKLTYSSMKDVFNEIKNENVCFNITEGTTPELMLWHNPEKFK